MPDFCGNALIKMRVVLQMALRSTYFIDEFKRYGFSRLVTVAGKGFPHFVLR